MACIYSGHFFYSLPPVTRAQRSECSANVYAVLAQHKDSWELVAESSQNSTCQAVDPTPGALSPIRGDAFFLIVTKVLVKPALALNLSIR